MPAHHRPGGGFRNPWPTAAQPNTALALVRWLVVERLAGARSGGARRGGAPDAAPADAFPRAAPAFDAPRAAPDVLTATWVGHSTFLLQLGGWNVLTDPVWGERASPVPFAGPARYTPPGVAFDALPPVDAVVLSHDHYDHLDAPTVRRLARRYPEAHWLAPLGVGALLRALGARRVAERDWWGEWSAPADAGGAAAGGAAGPLEATCVPAQHFSGRGVTNRDATLWAGWVLRAPAAGPRAAVYFAGDTGLHPDFAGVGRRCGPLALALLPVGAYAPRWFMRPVHCDPDDAVAAYDALCAGLAEASPGAAPPAFGAAHFGTFRLTDEPVGEPPRRTRAAWASGAAAPRAAALWVPRHGETWRAAPNAGGAAGG